MALPTAVQGNRIENTVLITLTDTVAKGESCTFAGAHPGAGAIVAGIALESGVSGQKISVQIAGIARWKVGSAGVSAAGVAVMSDASGLCTDQTSTNIKIGQALQAGASGDYVQVHLWAA